MRLITCSCLLLLTAFPAMAQQSVQIGPEQPTGAIPMQQGIQQGGNGLQPQGAAIYRDAPTTIPSGNATGMGTVTPQMPQRDLNNANPLTDRNGVVIKQIRPARGAKNQAIINNTLNRNSERQLEQRQR